MSRGSLISDGPFAWAGRRADALFCNLDAGQMYNISVLRRPRTSGTQRILLLANVIHMLPRLSGEGLGNTPDHNRRDIGAARYVPTGSDPHG